MNQDIISSVIFAVYVSLIIIGIVFLILKANKNNKWNYPKKLTKYG